MSVSLFQSLQIIIDPGGGSDFRFKYPPKITTHKLGVDTREVVTSAQAVLAMALNYLGFTSTLYNGEIEAVSMMEIWHSLAFDHAGHATLSFLASGRRVSFF